MEDLSVNSNFAYSKAISSDVVFQRPFSATFQHTKPQDRRHSFCNDHSYNADVNLCDIIGMIVLRIVPGLMMGLMLGKGMRGMCVDWMGGWLAVCTK